MIKYIKYIILRIENGLKLLFLAKMVILGQLYIFRTAARMRSNHTSN